MHRTGHYGAALLVYAPIGFLVLVLGFENLALLGGVIVVGGAMLPDWDMRVPFVPHRGPTHTLWFALAVGLIFGLAGVLIGSSTGILAALGLGGFGLLVGLLMVGAHLLADVLTPMGIRPLAPLNTDSYTFDVATAGNPLANYALLALGVLITAIAFALGTTVGTAIGV